MVWSGLVSSGLVLWHGGMTWSDLAWYIDMAVYTVWYGIAWYGGMPY